MDMGDTESFSLERFRMILRVLHLAPDGTPIPPPRQRHINSDPKENPLSEQGERRRGDLRQNGHMNLLSVRTALRGVRSLELATEQIHGNHGTQRQNKTDQSPDHRITSFQFCGIKKRESIDTCP